MSKIYQVTLPADFITNSRARAGVVVPAGKEGFVGELTDEQLEAIKADGQLTVSEVKTTAAKEETKKEEAVEVKTATAKKK